MDIEESVQQSLAAFAILDEDAWDVRHWIQSCTSSAALETFYEILGETELQVAHMCHVVETRLKELDES